MKNLSDIVGSPLHIFLLTRNEEFAATLQNLWASDQISWTVFSNGQLALEQAFNEPPDMVIAEQFLPGINGIDVLRALRAENVYRQICSILVAYNDALPDLPSASLHVDELIILPSSADKMRVRVELALYRTTIALDANPLTRLPGNTSIISAIQRLLSGGADFALAYLDMDNFKPYNDKYGFSRGDEMLLMTARLIANTVRTQHCEPSFVGHIGGDDFVFILSLDAMENACKSLVRDFDAIVPSFYDPDDRARRSIISFDRQGHELSFPILSISIAVVLNVNSRFTHYAELSHVAGQIKKIAKATPGSTYVFDRRH